MLASNSYIMQAEQPSGLGKSLAQAKHVSWRAVVVRLAQATQFGAPLVLAGFCSTEKAPFAGQRVSLIHELNEQTASPLCSTFNMTPVSGCYTI